MDKTNDSTSWALIQSRLRLGKRIGTLFHNIYTKYRYEVTYAIQKHHEWVLRWSYRDLRKYRTDELSMRICVQLGILDKKDEPKLFDEDVEKIYSQELEWLDNVPVSYTHLTLPTKA